jgi:hypothetical protein
LEVDVQQGNFKILRLLPQVLILFLVEKWIPPSRSETAKIGQKTEGILGVKSVFLAYFCIFFQLGYCNCSGLQSSPKTPPSIGHSQQLDLVRCAKRYNTLPALHC